MAAKGNIEKAVLQALSVGKDDAVVTVSGTDFRVLPYRDLDDDSGDNYILFESLLGTPETYFQGQYRMEGDLVFIIVIDTKTSPASIDEVADEIDKLLSFKRLQNGTETPIYATTVGFTEANTVDDNYPTGIRKRMIIPFSFVV